MIPASLTGVSPSAFKCGFRHVPTVVTIVLFEQPDPELPTGITIGSFVSLSLEPPLVCFNVMKTARSHDALVNGGSFVVHVLRDDQSDLSDRFAMPHYTSVEQMDGVRMVDGPFGYPVLDDALVRFDCRTEAVHDAGDHSIVVGCVVNVLEGGEGRPVVYHQRAYHAIGDHVAYTRLQESDSPDEPTPKNAKS